MKPWATPSTSRSAAICSRSARGAASRPTCRSATLDAAARDRRLVEDGDGDFHGIAAWFRWLEGRTYKMHVRVLLSRYRSYRTCPACDGAALKPEALDFRIGGRTIADVERA